MKPINLDSFIKQKKIGSGSYSKVYTIGDKRTGKILAAKVLNQQLNEDLDISDIQREINIISKLTHPAVLKFYGYCSTDFKQNHKLVIITDFASNGTLKNLLQKERENGSNQILNPTLKLIIIYGIAAAMLYLHWTNFYIQKLQILGYQRFNVKAQRIQQRSSKVHHFIWHQKYFISVNILKLLMFMHLH